MQSVSTVCVVGERHASSHTTPTMAGLFYDRKIDHYRTDEVNPILAMTQSFSDALNQNKSGQQEENPLLSALVVPRVLNPFSQSLLHVNYRLNLSQISRLTGKASIVKYIETFQAWQFIVRIRY